MSETPLTLETLFAEIKSLKEELAALQQKHSKDIDYLYKFMREDDEAIRREITERLQKYDTTNTTYFDNKIARIEMTLHAVTAEVLPGLTNFEHDVTRCVGPAVLHVPEHKSPTSKTSS
jgi:hypothetical protein